MRSRILPAIGVGAVAVAIATAYSIPASAHGIGVGTSTRSVTSATHINKGSEKPCYAQLTNASDNAIVSQNFTDSGFDAYDAQAADDFTLTKTCKFSDVEVAGTYFNGSGPCDSYNVTFYKDSGSSSPGKTLKGLGGTNLKYKVKNGLTTIDFGKKDKTLKPGTYWVSVQCNMAFAAGGEWGWNDSTTVTGDAGMWENPGNGFGTGCSSYGDTGTCLGLGESIDYAFAILQ